MALSRRAFIHGLGVAAPLVVGRHVLGRGATAPSDKLNVACVGCGGMGANDVANMASENIVALCDVDEARAAPTFKKHPEASKFRDFRKMLDTLDKQIDAVTVTTPDHSHYPVAIKAIGMGKHAFVQKPLAHTIWEARELTLAARKAKVATQMGIQGHSFEGVRLLQEWINDGAIGTVREVHAWTNKPVWPQGIGRPKDTPPVPSTLDWNLWVGTAPMRPYHPAYLPFTWRGWWDFGSCSLGDMGCHVLDHPVTALKLGYPTSIEAYSTPANDETGPLASILYYEFPARGDLPPVKLTWYDGGMMPPRPKGLERDRRMGDNEGVLYVGDKGTIMCGCYCRSPRLIPESRMKAYKRPPKTLPRSPGHYKEWIAACKGGPPAGANFDHAGPLAEIVQLGNVAIRTNALQKQNGRSVALLWDGPAMKCTNVPEANQFVRNELRKY
jgi:hypothetical protein